ncbi:C39 family peptidase [Candidatus Uabimicrobium amorphum]|uniref:Peptidase C39-like domain-containing protein n=1 Tax=Uabimicrobium amorphum TaxID=2596890 RepID=A0A5S9F681_UABAM|nr:C39 family peptidase [Candidatus Uabimicrobium amorphum]BBM86379.1 hypothetical protein UABAM_04765 [Candidatus Uabimicrobium amorphum]
MKNICLLLFVGSLCFAAEKSIVIADIPHIRQKPDFCGEACVAMYLQKFGFDITQDEVFNFSPTKAQLGRGCYTPEFAVAMKNIGFKIGKVWYKAKAPNYQQGVLQQWRQLYKDLLCGIPSVVCMHYADKPNTTEHFRLVTGYDATRDEVIYHEPAVANGAYRKMKRSLFLKLWPLKYKSVAWTVIRIPMNIDINQVKRLKKTHRFTKADYAQHIIQLKKKLRKTLGNQKFTIVIEKPFVVIGDEYPVVVKSRAVRTVRWAVNLLKKDYFSKDPEDIIDIWLFRNRTSYMQNTYKLFGSKPHTPFGYYSRADKVLIMNIRTGGGTLVHEIVHPFMRANFPQCPSWFDEGLASLYEQSREEKGLILGSTNWRLKGLQHAILANRVPKFQTLTSTTRYQFYNEDSGTNYSQARYLCYYLQEKKLLRKYYHTFRKNYAKDPTGYATLKEILSTHDMSQFQREWQKFVLSLRFKR